MESRDPHLSMYGCQAGGQGPSMAQHTSRELSLGTCMLSGMEGCGLLIEGGLGMCQRRTAEGECHE